MPGVAGAWRIDEYEVGGKSAKVSAFGCGCGEPEGTPFGGRRSECATGTDRAGL